MNPFWGRSPNRSADNGPTAAATPVTETTPVAVDPEAFRATLSTMLIQSLTVSVPVTSGVGIEGAVAFPWKMTDGSVLWLVYRIGIHSFDPEQNHLMAVYAPAADSWTEVARTEFATSDNSDQPGATPDYLGEF